MIRKMIVAFAVVVAAVVGSATTAWAHSVHVNTPSGQSSCTFLGGPGNLFHEGHSHGHVKAIAHEQSDVMTFGGPC